MSSKAKSKGKFEFIQNVLADTSLSSTAKCVVVALLLKWHNSRTGQCNPGLTEIAKAVGLTRRAVIPAVAELKKSGWLDIASTSGGSQRNTNRYKFDLSRIAPVSSTSPPAGEEDCTGEENFTAGVKQTSEGVKYTAHEPFKNPSPLWGEGEGDAAARRAPDGAPQEGEEQAWSEFSQLWQRGHADDPVKVRKAFDGAIAEHGATAILESARRWAETKERRFLPEPVKWLAGGWRTDPPSARSTGAGDGGGHRGRGKPNPVEEMLRAGGFEKSGGHWS
jgi:hypothetical protein